MNLPISAQNRELSSPRLVSSSTILLLSGVLFGLCVSEAISRDIKTTFLLAGTTGLLAYLGLGMVKRAHHETQQRIAIMHVEERLDRHANPDPRSSDQIETPV